MTFLHALQYLNYSTNIHLNQTTLHSSLSLLTTKKRYYRVKRSSTKHTVSKNNRTPIVRIDWDPKYDNWAANDQTLISSMVFRLFNPGLFDFAYFLLQIDNDYSPENWRNALHFHDSDDRISTVSNPPIDFSGGIALKSHLWRRKPSRYGPAHLVGPNPDKNLTLNST